MAGVMVSRRLLAGLGAALAVAVLAVAFLLGRTTGPSASVAAWAPPPQGAPAPPPLAGSGQAAPSSPPSLPTAVQAPMPQAQPPAPAGEPDPVRAAVGAYFHAVDQVQPGQLGGDPEALARGVLEGLVKGDVAGFDGMIRKTTEARANLAALTPPTPCASYHTKSLAVLDESLIMLQTIKDALQGPGTGAPAGDFTAQANRLRARTEALQAEEQDLRRRFGLAS